MADDVKTIARLMGAEVVATLPDVGGGAFGADRLAGIVARLRSRLQPGAGLRPGRPTDPAWTRHPKVPMTPETEAKLARMAASISTDDRRISPMQLAAQLLEQAVADLSTRVPS